MAKFDKGNKSGKKIDGEIAADMQKKSVASRRKNKTIAEYLRTYLGEALPDGHTRGEILVMQAVKNHKDGKLTFKDLRDLARILGEDTLTIKNEGPAVVPMTQEAIDALTKWTSKE